MQKMGNANTGLISADLMTESAYETSSEDRAHKVEDDFEPSKCLFCNRVNRNLDENLNHMLKIHGLFIPEDDHLMVDIETFLSYFHLIISTYFQCLWCSTERRSVVAIQQHMMCKGHCRFDIASRDSEFREFYDFDSGFEEEGREKENAGRVTMSSKSPIVQIDGTSLRLSSGKILFHRSTRQSRSPELKDGSKSNDRGPNINLPSGLNSAGLHASSVLTRAEKRDSEFSNQLVQLRAEDRRSLMHLPVSQQRAVLVTQKKQMDRIRKAERKMLGRVETLGNKALMTHYVPDTPGRSNG
jgi:pre-60S factor REI1